MFLYLLYASIKRDFNRIYNSQTIWLAKKYIMLGSFFTKLPFLEFSF